MKLTNKKRSDAYKALDKFFKTTLLGMPYREFIKDHGEIVDIGVNTINVNEIIERYVNICL